MEAGGLAVIHGRLGPEKLNEESELRQDEQ